jgi:RNA polymerase sigma-70 factor (ECF subfamily)
MKFERLYEACFAEIYAYVARRRAPHQVADLVAEVFATSWRRIDAVPPAPEDRLWLYGVARRILSQDERSTHRRRALFNRLVQNRSYSRQHSDTDESDVAEHLRSLVRHLKPIDREVVRLIVWESLTHDEVAQILGCSANTVAIRWHRSIARLRNGLTRPDDAEVTLPQPQKEDSDGD